MVLLMMLTLRVLLVLGMVLSLRTMLRMGMLLLWVLWMLTMLSVRVLLSVWLSVLLLLAMGSRILTRSIGSEVVAPGHVRLVMRRAAIRYNISITKQGAIWLSELRGQEGTST